MPNRRRRAHYDPATRIIALFGGARRVSAMINVSSTAPYLWRYGREHGGTGGVIPQKHHRALLAWAKAEGLKLSADDFLPPD
jgi:hypothetical protein